jgi:16S rRNA A1518/A1519 N6-dimethyltransferase RsmA/KsgA/DIM1 with predicted DNA glycosylase/AP lyase activity
MFEDLFALLPAHPHVIEVGPGTGQATRDLLAYGATVHAIEIGPAMAGKLREVLPNSSLTVTVGDFEHVPIGPRRPGNARRARCRRPFRTSRGSSL